MSTTYLIEIHSLHRRVAHFHAATWDEAIERAWERFRTRMETPRTWTKLVTITNQGKMWDVTEIMGRRWKRELRKNGRLS